MEIKKRIVFTVITKNYLARARALAKSVKRHNPGLEMAVLLADGVDGCFDPEKEPFRLVRLEELPDQETIRKMTFYYSQIEICCALRPFFHEYIRSLGYERWIFMDCDTLVFSSFDPVFRELENASILLTPHLNAPCEDEKTADLMERPILRGGVYNAGFLGIRNSETSAAFLKWWKTRLIKYAFLRPENGQFMDQLWLGLAPIFFQGVKVLTHSGVNMVFWNLHERGLEEKDGRFTAGDGSPLVLYHFSGWDPDFPEKLTKYLDPEDMPRNKAVTNILKAYSRELFESGQEQTKNFPYSFAVFENGRPVFPDMRMKYFTMLSENRWPGGSPFSRHELFETQKPVYSGPLFWRMRRFASRLKQALITKSKTRPEGKKP